ncbi:MULTISPECIES: DUF2993 domain-containing protein [unclassified Pseudofrankia]|uniref:DUF2993 domain-containing protein n=1 Tax=unclassified Pseudofrankia TaxID=2994372 RepID=UPI001F5197FE|nr:MULTISPECIES: DUF2993 domain-containing protein [unclassified Pseudofrankia]MDT3438766.1 LmeA family phospholipid-binding protein [Pseudofrankia sp. BMG5.37]
MNNPTDDEAYEPGEVARVRRDSADRRGRRGPNRPGAPSAPPPPPESFRPAGPPPPADWFKPASGGAGADETARSRRDAGGPGSTGYTSQPGIPVERYPTPRPGEFPSPVPPTRRTQPPASGGTPRPQERPGGERPTEYIGRVGSGGGAGARTPGQGSGVSKPTEQLGYGQLDDEDEYVDPAAVTEHSEPYSPVPAVGWQAARADGGGWRDGTGGLPAAGSGTGGPPVPGGGAAGEKPPKKRRRRGRLIALIVVVLLLILAIPLDRVVAHIAVGQMRKQVEVAVAQNMKEGQQPPIVRKVSLGGFPFLTQILFGKFKDIGVTLENIPTTADGPKIAGVDAHLKGAHVPLGDAISNNVGKVPVDNVEATVRINYDEINAFLKDKPFHWQLAPADGGKKVQITGQDQTTIPVVGTKVDVTLTGVGSFTVANNQLKITPSEVSGSVNGLSTPDLGDLVSNASIPVPLPLPDNLPFDLTIVSAGTTATGLSVSATAKDVVLPAQSAK